MGVKTFTHSSSSHSQEMLGKLNMLRNDGHFCDITIRVQDKIFRAHKVVLAACSDFFRTKLVGQAEDENKNVLDLHHVTVTGFIPLLEYAYTATLSINTENIIDVLAAASYMQMFSVASTCSEFMKSSILWNTPNSQPEKSLDAGQENNSNCNFTSRDGSISPVSSECSVVERTIPVCRESRRKRKSYIVMSPESPVKCSTQTSSPQVLNSSASYSENRNQPVDSSLAFPWTFPFGIDRRIQPDKVKQAEGTRTLELPGPSETGRRMPDYVTCESTKTALPLGTEEDVRVKVERLSDEEVHEEVSQPVSASQSSLSDQQTVPGSEQVQEDLLISPQSSSIGSVDEGVTEGLPTLQSTSSTNAHADDDDRLENVQYPYQLYIAPSTSSTERPSPNGPDRPFQCPTCGVRFTRIQNLKQHMLIHSGIKPFQCDRCGKKFTRAYSLKMHRLKHEGKRCFRCQICSATFTSFGEYKHHMRVSRHIIRKPRIYECKTCGAMFTNSGNLIVHLRSLNHEASELANYFQSSDFLVPDYLNQEQEETLVQYDLGEHSFESNSSVQMPVISQVSSTQNCESTFPLGSLGGLAEKEEEMPEQPKTSAGAEATRVDPPKSELSSITIE
ncbi:zinc finger and BTB domain-containing protein 44 isoform X1 [Phacochoerus africanus]|uniref:zinc finger and BTB domain-containing protein 44 isoform X1 n=1 Tax=Phacochoerus africanus TaxID=41426 RepID=UPI001FDA3AE6|nr:zinc finger and BTB domain-containing protein 44 isoform X1 [Phacochoerus africanus]XP_047610241.1 zinc finger and BTB domain-containing protein 44 isoform X1 [Phacochoerus africanus]XP_047610242.1 zinc finger and BTB domain-containing protein 44 isoform X1 [Phacochoerus africanus]XP_047610243.1 zinc finger and BTB domain-containing protein 44 isoform X1 [Phacochoerus africanus]